MNILRKRDFAARRIQKAWKNCRGNDIFNIMRKYRNMQATIIQRYLRGYIVKHHLLTNIRKQKLMINEQFFDGLKGDLETKAIIKIQRYVRKFLAII